MLTFRREVRVPAAGPGVFGYLADFTTTDEWDPRASAVRRVSGDGQEGSTYRCDVAFLGRSIPMLYTTTRLIDDTRIERVGTSRLVRTHDVMHVLPDADGVAVEYTMRVQFERAPRTWEALLRGRVDRLADDAEAGLRSALLDRFARSQPAGL